MNSSSEGTLSRCGEDEIDGVADAMAIMQGYTPSGLATSSAAKVVESSSAQDKSAATSGI